jgi:hypothetical protein
MTLAVNGRPRPTLSKPIFGISWADAAAATIRAAAALAGIFPKLMLDSS